MLKDCLPTICNGTDLMNGQDEFMEKQDVEDRCKDCIQQKVCIEICDLLSKDLFAEAEKLLLGK